jgi:RNA-directed DNA polymerase
MSLDEKMALDLLINAAFVRRTAASASHRYKVYAIAKKRGGERVIHHPAKPLKALQRWLLYNVVEAFPVHHAAYAYRTGREYGIRRNAEQHQASAYLLRLDFESFFPSITADDIRLFLSEHGRAHWPWWTSGDSDLFCELVCRDRRLTIGAPTSPALSNVLCFLLDTHCAALAATYGAVYTRYADDLFFSTETGDTLRHFDQAIETIVRALPYPKNLRLNSAKTAHLSKKGRRTVTGLVLTSEGGVSVGRSVKRRIRAMVHQFDRLSNRERQYLAGWLAHCSDVEPNFINSLVLSYGVDRVQRARRPPGDEPPQRPSS